MIILYFGDDIVRSRTDFLSIHEKRPDSPHFDGKEVTITELAQVFDGGGLFGNTQTIFIENLLTQRKESKEVAGIRSYLNEKSVEHTIYMWEGKDLTKAQLGKLTSISPKQYKLPQTLFQFLEALFPGNGTRAIQLFHATLTNSEPEMIFFMLIRHLRILLSLSYKETIEETKRIADWQRGKLIKQVNAIGTTQLKVLYLRLSHIDTGAKTGTLGVSLTTAIDLLLLEL